MSLSSASRPSEKLAMPSRTYKQRRAGKQPNHLMLATKPKGGKTSLAMAPSQCHRLLLLLVLLVTSSRGGSSDETYDTSKCLLQPSTCGTVNIRYPFYLSDETGVVKGSNGSYCGYPGLAILCDDDKAILLLNGREKYTVKGIDDASDTVSLAYPEVPDDGSGCPRVDHNVTSLPPGLRFPDGAVDYLVFFLGCYFNSTLPQPRTIDPITCHIFGVSTEFSFVLPKDKVPPGNWPQACQQVIEVPVRRDNLMDPKNPTWRSGGYGDFLRQGFQLAWDRPPARCLPCEQSKGRCGYNGNGEFIGCLCPNGRVNNQGCGNAGKHFESATVPNCKGGR